MRMEPKRILRQVVDADLHERKNRERPRKKWKICVESDLEKLGVKRLRTVAQVRKKWRTIESMSL